MDIVSSLSGLHTGLSGEGKSTIAHTVEERLHCLGCRTYVFDGDNVRQGLCSDLGFSLKERSENLRRIAEMVKLFFDAGVIALCAFIVPPSVRTVRVSRPLPVRMTFWRYIATVLWRSANNEIPKCFIKRPGLE